MISLVFLAVGMAAILLATLWAREEHQRYPLQPPSAGERAQGLWWWRFITAEATTLAGLLFFLGVLLVALGVLALGWSRGLVLIGILGFLVLFIWLFPGGKAAEKAKWVPRSAPEARLAWYRALQSFLALADTPKREKRAAVIESIKERLSEIATIEELYKSYLADDAWCRELTYRLHPEAAWWREGDDETRDAAYGLRLVELMIGKRIDATRPLPRWISEWATK